MVNIQPGHWLDPVSNHSNTFSFKAYGPSLCLRWTFHTWLKNNLFFNLHPALFGSLDEELWVSLSCISHSTVHKSSKQKALRPLCPSAKLKAMETKPVFSRANSFGTGNKHKTVIGFFRITSWRKLSDYFKRPKMLAFIIALVGELEWSFNSRKQQGTNSFGSMDLRSLHQHDRRNPMVYDQFVPWTVVFRL